MSLQPRLYYRYFDNGKSLHEAFATGGAMILATGWWRDTLQLGIASYTPQPLATRHDPGGTGENKSENKFTDFSDVRSYI